MMRDLDCSEFVELTTEYFEGALGPDEVKRLEAHLNECDGCSEYLAQMRLTQSTLGYLDPREIPEAKMGPLLSAFRAWKEEHRG